MYAREMDPVSFVSRQERDKRKQLLKSRLEDVPLSAFTVREFEALIPLLTVGQHMNLPTSGEDLELLENKALELGV